jgi:pimeloyl-ACP methyl ester carboxylesterase
MATLALLLTVLLAFFAQVHGILIPGPDDKHQWKAAVADFSLVDKSRKDPHMPIPKSTCSSECPRPYMGDLTAKIANNQTLGDFNMGVFEKMEYNVCCSVNAAIDASKIPVVVLEPHTDTSRLFYANLARYMTANNVAVVLIDHPHDSSVVEFPHSSAVLNGGATGLSNFSPLTEWNSTITKAIDIRVQDIHMALEQLKDPSILTRNFINFKFTSGLDTSSYSVVGHGLGGAVATELSISDPRVRLSINLSGSAPPLDHDIKAPIYFLGRSDFRRENDINWPETWQHLTGPATEFDMGDSGIMDFTDLPVVIEASGIKDLKGFGLGSSGPWANHAVKCFVEGIIFDKIHGNSGGLSNCVRIFEDRLIPYMAGPGRIVAMEEQSAAAMSRRSTVGANVRHTLENWGFL